MILHAQGLVGSSSAVQLALWEEIKGNTAGKRSSRASTFCQSAPCPSFRNMIAETCPKRALVKRSSVFCWCSYPTALKDALNAHLTSAVDVVTAGTEADIQERIIASLNDAVPPVVLVKNAQHWVIVFGHNPEAKYPVKIRDTQFPGRIGITMSKWKATYLTVAPCGQFKNLCVIVGSDLGAPPPPPPSPPPVVNPGLPGPNHMALLPPDVIRQRAIDEARDLARQSEWRAAFGSAQPRKPLLVRNPDTGDAESYIVDFRTGDRPTGRMLIDPRTGVPDEMAAVEADDASLQPFLTPDEVVTLLERGFSDSTIGAITLKPGGYTLDDDLVWAPCDQSHSAFQPFYVVRYDGRILYVRVDGRIFSGPLTHDGAGA